MGISEPLKLFLDNPLLLPDAPKLSLKQQKPPTKLQQFIHFDKPHNCSSNKRTNFFDSSFKLLLEALTLQLHLKSKLLSALSVCLTPSPNIPPSSSSFLLPN